MTDRPSKLRKHCLSEAVRVFSNTGGGTPDLILATAERFENFIQKETAAAALGSGGSIHASASFHESMMRMNKACRHCGKV